MLECLGRARQCLSIKPQVESMGLLQASQLSCYLDSNNDSLVGEGFLVLRTAFLPGQ